MGKKNVHKLSPEQESTLILLGISSHENDYRLSWSINEQLGMQFSKDENHKAFHSKLKETQEFSAYSFNDGSFLYKLISNRSSNGYLLEELKNIDYFMMVEENETVFPVKDFIAQVKSVPFVSAVFHIDPAVVKNKNRLK